MSDFLEIICLKCQNLRKLQRREKYKIWLKPKSFPTSSQSIGVQYPIIDNIVSLSYNWWNIMSCHFCRKVEQKMLQKISLWWRFKIQRTYRISFLYLLPKFHKLLLLLPNQVLKDKVIIWHPSAKPEKVLYIYMHVYLVLLFLNSIVISNTNFNISLCLWFYSYCTH